MAAKLKFSIHILVLVEIGRNVSLYFKYVIYNYAYNGPKTNYNRFNVIKKNYICNVIYNNKNFVCYCEFRYIFEYQIFKLEN